MSESRSSAARVRRVCGAVVAFIGGTALLGWALDVAALKSVHPAWVTMKANTAIGFVLSGLAICLLESPRARRGLAFLVALLGLLTLSEYLFRRDLGIDQAIFCEPAGAVATSHPGRMAPGTAICFLLTGSALLRPRWATALVLPAGFIAFLAFVGYAYGVSDLEGPSRYTRMAAHTAAAFLLLSLGTIAARPPAALASDTGGGVQARRLLPAAIGLPILLGWLRLKGEHAGLYATEFGVALTACVTVAIFAGLVLATSGTIVRNEEAVRAINQELEAFSYSVSHDLRAPLRHIDGFAALLEKHSVPSLDEKGLRYLHTISDSAKRMGRLIDDLLHFSRTGRAEMRLQTVDLDALVRNVVREAEGRVTWDIRPLPAVRGDAALLRQALSNLVSNAVKYSRSRPEPRVEIGAREEPGEVVVWVRDNGVGFDMRYAGKLFGVFQRLHNPDEFEGTGIGLANVRRIIQRHGGRTWAEGRVGEGATFSFSVPR